MDNGIKEKVARLEEGFKYFEERVQNIENLFNKYNETWTQQWIEIRENVLLIKQEIQNMNKKLNQMNGIKGEINGEMDKIKKSIETIKKWIFIIIVFSLVVNPATSNIFKFILNILIK